MKDKIVFWFGADFTQFCMAYFFQKKYDCDMYSIVDITNNPKKFFKNQKLIPFQKTWFLHDEYNSKLKPNIEYLKKFEEKYKINLWQLAINERFFYNFNEFYKFSTDEILSITEQICRFYESFFDEVSPDFFITKLTGFYHLELFRLMCKYHGTKILMLSGPKVAGKSLISENDNRVDNVSDLSEITCNDKNFDELKTDFKNLSTKNQVHQVWNSHSSSSLKNNLKPLFRFIKSNNHQNIQTNYNYYGRTKFNVLKNAITLSLKKSYRESFMNRNFIHKPDLTTPYVYFAMSVILERGILIASPYLTNQNEVIRHIAKSLPAGYRLLVKEHPVQKSREWRPISEYKEIMDIPNVTLIHHSFSETELLKNSSLVISIAGSSSLESAFFEKPSIVFSDLIYSYLPSVSKVDAIDDLPKIIEKSLKTKVQPNDIGKYLKLLSENLVDFDHTKFMMGDFYQHFYLNGGYLDSEINENDLKLFLYEHEDILEILSTAHIEKIKQHKQIQI